MATDYWFKRKRYGWGYTPSTWQGWVTVGLYVVIALGLALTLVELPEDTAAREIGFFGLFMVLATIGFVQITIKKGPKPKWRWGRSPEDNPDEDY